MERRKKHGWIWLVVIAVLIAGGVFAWRYFDNVAKQTAEATLASATQTYNVERGNIDTLVTANGSLGAEETHTVNIPDGLMIEDILVAAGDAVHKGDAIARIGADSIHQQLIYLRSQLSKEEGSLKTAGHFDSIKCPATGRLVYQPVQPGDDVLDAMVKYGLLCIISTDGFMRMEVKTDKLLALGSRMRVEWDGGAAKGTVDSKTPDGYVLLIPDTDIPYQTFATLVDDTGEIGSGTAEVNMPIEVYGYDGVIRSTGYVVGESVADGKELYEVKNAPVSLSFASHYVADKLLSTQYKTLITYMMRPYILAPEDGVIAEVSFKEGVRSGSTANADKESAAYKLSIGNKMVMTVDVDELDILKLTTGQHANVTLDALPDETLSGEVTRISRIGKKNNNVSAFAVEITMDSDERLLSGMNGSATIEIDRAENVLVLPVAAIIEEADGIYVDRISEGGATARIPITTGRSNGTIAEITSGLSEGDVISYTVAGDFDLAMMGTMVSTSDSAEDDDVIITDVEG